MGVNDGGNGIGRVVKPIDELKGACAQHTDDKQ